MTREGDGLPSWMARFAWTLWAWMALLLAAGGLVTSGGFGLAVPDAPTTYGRELFLYPWFRSAFDIFVEHGHRLIGRTFGIAYLAFLALLWRREGRLAVRLWAGGVFLAVAAQGILGQERVIRDARMLALLHGILAQICFAGMSVLLVLIRRTPDGTAPASAPRAVSIARCMGAALLLQVVFGAILRHFGFALHWHVAGAMLLAAMAVSLRRAAADGPLRAASTQTLWLLGIQTVLGLLSWSARGGYPVAWIVLRPWLGVLLPTLHLAVAALLVARISSAAAIGWSPAPGRAFAPRGLGDWLQMTRPRVCLLVAATVAAGYYLGATDAFRVPELLWAIAGTLLLAGGGGILNQVIERDADAMMRRTADRPIPAGRIAPRRALAAGAAVAITGVAILALKVNLLTAALGLASAALYLGVYTPMKRLSPFNTLVGAVPGAIPALMGWAAGAGRLDEGAWTLFGIVFLWQLPHFLAIAWLYREDYARAGFRMLTLGDDLGGRTARQAVAYCLGLLPLSLLPAVSGHGGPVYFYAALYLGVLFLGFAVWFLARRTDEIARRLVFASVLYLPSLLAVWVQERALL